MVSARIREFLESNGCMYPEACELQEGNCYAGQWTVHAPHHYETQGAGMNFYLGKYQVHCPGKTEQDTIKN